MFVKLDYTFLEKSQEPSLGSLNDSGDRKISNSIFKISATIMLMRVTAGAIKIKGGYPISQNHIQYQFVILSVVYTAYIHLINKLNCKSPSPYLIKYD